MDSKESLEKKYVEDFPSFYQDEGVKKILREKRLLIADEMGVGKTAQAIAGKLLIENERLFKSYLEQIGECRGRPADIQYLGRDEGLDRVRTLIITPDYVKDHWESEIEQACERDQKVTRIDNYTEEELRESESSDFTLLNYHVFGNPDYRDWITESLLEQGFEYLILDETHNVKNPRAYRSDRVKSLADNAEYLALLSGTDIPDSLRDTYMLIAMLEPEAYEDAEKVRKMHWDEPRTIRNVLNRKRLKRSLDKVANVPPLFTKERNIELSEEERKLYDAILENDSLKGPKKLRELRYALLDPQLVDPQVIPYPEIRSDFDTITSTKFQELDKIVEECVENNEKIVVYSPHRVTDVTDKLEKRYEEYGSLRVDGSIKPIEARSEIINEFKEDEDKHVLIATPATAGEGISLIESSEVVFLEEPYSPGVRKQLISRVRRRGQKDSVKLTSLVVENSVDEGVLELLKRKENGIKFIEEGKELGPEEIRALQKRGESPITRRIYTPQQKVRRLASRMFEQGHENIRKNLERRDGRIGRKYAENFVKDWEDSYSANTAEVYKEVLQQLFDEKPEKTVDLGSGPGVLSYVTGWETSNIDINKYMFEQWMANSRNENIVGPIHDLPFEDEQFDLALCSLSLNYTSPELKEDEEDFSERETAIREVNRILKDDGIYLITLPHSTMTPETDRSLREGLTQAGFEVFPELTGFVRSLDETDFQVYISTAKKVEEPSQESFGNKFSLERVEDYPFTMRRHGLSPEFEFFDKELDKDG